MSDVADGHDVGQSGDYAKEKPYDKELNSSFIDCIAEVFISIREDPEQAKKSVADP